MTTRTITANTVDLLGVVREGVVYTFRLLSSIATDATPSIIPTDDTQTMTSDANGDSSIALIVPASGAYLYECKLPDGRLVTFGLESGASVDLSTLIADANLDSVTVAGTIATLLAAYLPKADNLGSVASAATSLSNIGGQPVDATLTSLALLGTAGDKLAYTTGVDTWAETALTAAARTLLDDATVAAMLATLGAMASDGSIAMSGDLDMAANEIQNYAEEVNTATGSSYAVDFTINGLHEITMNGNLTVTFSNLAAGKSVTLMLIQDATGNRTVTSWPTISWTDSDTEPTLGATAEGKWDTITLWVRADGSTVCGAYVGTNE